MAPLPEGSGPRRVLRAAFFNRPTLDVAADLIGKHLVRRADGVARAYLVTEVEAYDGPEDAACHAFRGRTKRNEVLFGRAGVFYVYFTYGMHHMLNVVTGPAGYPSGVLIRGLEGISGPGRLTKALGITRELDRVPAQRVRGLWFEDRGVVVPRRRIARTPRIGIDYAGPEWAAKPYRFVLRD